MIPTFNVAGTGLFGGHRRVVTDPFRDNVVVLLEGEGANGGTTIVDSGPHGITMSLVGSYTTSTAQFKQGTASLLTNGLGGVLHYTNTAQTLIAGDWTIEMWMYSVSGQFYLIDNSQSNPDQRLKIFRAGDTTITFGGNGGTHITGGTSSNNAWHHYVAQNVAGTIELGLDGVSQGTWTGNPGLPAVGSRTHIGCSFAGQEGIAYMDEIRISNIARYTFPFTPPTGPLY